MQLKGLVRFFTILLIVYSLYQLSFTWFVKRHENRMEARALAFVKANYPGAEKYSKVKQLPDSLKTVFNERLKRLLDSTKDVTVTYGINGAMSYQKAKEEELNLGLDLQGGMNVTLEVEMTGLLRSLSNNSRDPNFLKAIENANNRKANSDADFITLFIEEYRKLEKDRPLASLFAGASSGAITVSSSDGDVQRYLRTAAKDAFDNTFRILSTRIDQFGVAQPNINPNSDRGIIIVELPGIQDKERVRKQLQSTANLQFWEVYTLADQNYANSWSKAVTEFNAKYGGIKDTTRVADTTKKSDTTASTVAGTPGDTTDKTKLSKQIGLDDTSTTNQPAVTSQNTIDRYLQIFNPSQDNQGKVFYPAAIGQVSIKDTAQFRTYLEELRNLFPFDVRWAYGIPERDKKGRAQSTVPLYALKTYNRTKARLEGDAVTNARQDFDQQGNVEVIMNMNNTGSAEWGKMTAENVGKPIAIVLDNIVYSAPNVITKIDGGISTISGGFSQQEAVDLANLLKIGKLPAPAKIVQEQQVGPTLGRAAIRAGTMAFLISFVVIFLLMLIYYNTSGWIANIALILNLLFTIGVLAGLGATLTAPGIAGLVLTIGMAVDTNVIIYERIKEELTKGKGYIPAINEGYRRSLPPVLDGHVTTLLTAIILFYFGLGPVKGFATTQILGIILSLFCGILVSRWVSEWFTSKKRHLEYFTPLSRRLFKHANFQFIKYRKVAYGISIIVLGLGIGSYFNGFNQGVEFKGGRSYKIQFDKPVDVEQVRDDLQAAFEGENPVIKTIGDNSTLDITTSFMITNPDATADSIVETKLMAGLKNHLPPSLSFEKFDTEYKLESNKVLPTISDDLKAGAVKATIIALIAIFLYIFIRFRDWRYSLGTIVALGHDVLVTLIVFSFAKNIVPFPLEIDQHFIAAILTVIGFSMNDTVVVFDRIREYGREMRGMDKTTIINRAINDTLSRTIMTSVTVFLTLLILFLVGGEVTRGFAFAMLIGVITGSYSTIFVAAPILVDIAKHKPLGRADTADVKQKSTVTRPVKV